MEYQDPREDSHDSEEEYDENDYVDYSDPMDQSIFKVNQPKQYNKKAQNTMLSLKCSICKKKGHSDFACFRHPDPETALKNQQRKNLPSCMLCAGKNHLSPQCTLYAGLTPSYEACKHCNEKGEYERYHPSDKCKQKDEENE